MSWTAMTDSNRSDGLAGKPVSLDQERLEAVERWLEYLRTEPPEVWGPQQNAIVNSQLESARATGYDIERERWAEAFATAELARD